MQRQDEYDDDAPEEADAELGDEIDDNLDVEEEEGRPLAFLQFVIGIPT